MRKLFLIAVLFAALTSSDLYAETRHAARVRTYKRMTGHPHGWADHVVDHIIPLCAGGADAVTNMQWQLVVDAKIKDRWEKGLCASMRKQGLILVKRPQV